MTPKPCPNGTLVFRLLSVHPYPVASGLRLNVQGVCRFTIDGVDWCFDDRWYIGDETIAHHLPAAEHVNADLLHAEIRRVRVLVDGEGSPTGAEIEADCVGPDLPADDPLYDRATAEQALAKVTAERDALIVAESTLSKIAAALAIPALEPHDDALSMVKRLVDGYTVVSQRLIGAQKEVAERDVTIESKESKIIDLTLRLGQTQNRVGDLESELAGVRRDAAAIRRERDRYATDLTGEHEKVKQLTVQREAAHKVLDDAGIARVPSDTAPRLTLAVRIGAALARADKAEADLAHYKTALEGQKCQTMRLLRQRNAAHAVLDKAGFAMPREGMRRRPLAVRVGLAHAQVWDSYDFINAIDEIAKIVGLVSPCRTDGAEASEVVAAVKALRNDDALRAEIAVAVGLDDSASLSLILATVKDCDPDLLRLLDYHQAPIRFNDRPLTTAERAAFVIRRLWQGRANAASEASALRRELSEITDALAHLPDCAERAPIGQVTEYLSLNAAERIRLAFPKG